MHSVNFENSWKVLVECAGTFDEMGNTPFVTVIAPTDEDAKQLVSSFGTPVYATYQGRVIVA